jgi:hypothetical protein
MINHPPGHTPIDPDMSVITTRLRTVNVVQFNAAEYGRPGGSIKTEQDRQVEQLIARESPMLACVQEVFGATAHEAAANVQRLARATGLECRLPDGRVAVSIGAHDMHCAILWRPDVVTPTGTWRMYGQGELWHALIIGVVEIDGFRLGIGCYHAPSLERDVRAAEAERIVHASLTTACPHVLICMDGNALSGTRTTDGGFYDQDVYEQQKNWHPQFVFQCQWTRDTDGTISSWHADRRPSDVLTAGGLVDAAAALGEPWAATIGHKHPNGPHTRRRVDIAWATQALVPALRGSRPVQDALTEAASDHLPVVTVMDLTMLAFADVGWLQAALDRRRQLVSSIDFTQLTPQRSDAMRAIGVEIGALKWRLDDLGVLITDT